MHLSTKIICIQGIEKIMFKLIILFQNNRTCTLISQDADKMWAYTKYIQNQIYFKSNPTPTQQLLHKKKYISHAQYLRLKFQHQILVLKSQGLLRSRIATVFQALDLIKMKQYNRTFIEKSKSLDEQDQDNQLMFLNSSRFNEQESGNLNESYDQFSKLNPVSKFKQVIRNFDTEVKSSEKLSQLATRKPSPVVKTKKLNPFESHSLIFAQNTFTTKQATRKLDESELKEGYEMREQSPSGVHHTKNPRGLDSYFSSDNEPTQMSSNMRYKSTTSFQFQSKMKMNRVISQKQIIKPQLWKLLNDENKPPALDIKDLDLSHMRLNHQRSEMDFHQKHKIVTSPSDQAKTFENKRNQLSNVEMPVKSLFQLQNCLNSIAPQSARSQSDSNDETLDVYLNSGFNTNRNLTNKLLSSNLNNQQNFNFMFQSPQTPQVLNSRLSIRNSQKDSNFSKALNEKRESNFSNQNYQSNSNNHGNYAQTIVLNQGSNGAITFPSSISTVDRKEQRQLMKMYQTNQHSKLEKNLNNQINEILCDDSNVLNGLYSSQNQESQNSYQTDEQLFDDVQDEEILEEEKISILNKINSSKIDHQFQQNLASKQTLGQQNHTTHTTNDANILGSYMITPSFDNYKHKRDQSIKLQNQKLPLNRVNNQIFISPNQNHSKILNPNDYASTESKVEFNVLQQSNLNAYTNTNYDDDTIISVSNKPPFSSMSMNQQNNKSNINGKNVHKKGNSQFEPDFINSGMKPINALKMRLKSLNHQKENQQPDDHLNKFRLKHQKSQNRNCTDYNSFSEQASKLQGFQSRNKSNFYQNNITLDQQCKNCSNMIGSDAKNQSLLSDYLVAKTYNKSLQNKLLKVHLNSFKQDFSLNIKKQDISTTLLKRNEDLYLAEIEELRDQLLCEKYSHNKTKQEKDEVRKECQKVKEQYQQLLRIIQEMCPDLIELLQKRLLAQGDKSRYIREGGISMKELVKILQSHFDDKNDTNSITQNSSNQGSLANLQYLLCGLGNLPDSQEININLSKKSNHSNNNNENNQIFANQNLI
eukprot:403376555